MKNAKYALMAAFVGLSIGIDAVTSDEEQSRWVFDTSGRREPAVWTGTSVSAAIDPCGSVSQTSVDATIDGTFQDSEKSVEFDVSLEDVGILLIVR